MGALIQTKGTQKLAKWFNTRFSDLSLTRGWKNAPSGGAPTLIKTAFGSGRLLDISDAFIAQNADPANWPPDMNDLLYPSATLKIDTVVNSTTLKFKVPGGQPDAIVQDSAVCFLGTPRSKIQKKTKVTGTPALSGGFLTVSLSKAVSATNPPAPGDLISFAKGKHERLVRRWRWYLEKDLKQQNNDAIRQSISEALDDDDFVSILFQTVEDTQRVIATPQTKLDGTVNDELSDDMVMSILLMTQATTSPDKLDPQ